MALKILIVDDEHRIVQTLSYILEGNGYITASACGGDEAVTTARDFLPDLLLSDIMMPGLNGFEAALQIKQFAPQCRLLFFSGHPVTAFIAQEFAQTLTARGYDFQLLPKPIAPTMLLRTVEEALLQT